MHLPYACSPSDGNAKLMLFCETLLADSQESQMYIGTGVDRIQVNQAGDDVVMPGGLLILN